MKLNHQNYFSKEASQFYMSVSQYKSFVGTSGRKGCEAKAMAEINGEWTFEVTPSMQVGSYVDAHFSGTLDVFKAQNADIFTKQGELKSPFQQANDIIARIERDPIMMKFLSGQTQRIFTGEIFGIPWKGMVDVYHPGKAIVDLKIVKQIDEALWVKDTGSMSFPEYWGYLIQAAVYQELVRQETKEKLPFFIAAASKEKYPDIQVIGFTDEELTAALNNVFANINRVIEVKSGRAEPVRCGGCDFCRATKVLTGPIHYSELILR